MATATATPPRPRPHRARRVLRTAGISLAALLALGLALAAWLLNTGAGARLALAHAAGLTNGRLSVEASRGTLAGPLHLKGLRWRDAEAGVDAQVADIEVDLAVRALLALRVQVDRLRVDGVDVALSEVPEQDKEPSGGFSLEPPIDLVLDDVRVTGFALTRDGEPLFAFDTFDLAASWTGAGADVRVLELKAAEGEASLDGRIAALPGHPGDGQARFQWKLDGRLYAGELAAHSDGKAARLQLALASPTAAEASGEIQLTDALPWTAQVAVPRFDPARLGVDGMDALALELTASGGRDHARISGDVTIDAWRLHLEPLAVRLDGERLLLEELALTSPDFAGRLNAEGTLQLDAEPISGQARLHWEGIELPAELAGQALASHGELTASGNADAWQASGNLALGPPGQLADIALDTHGTAQEILIRRLAIDQAAGHLAAEGSVSLQPGIGWDIEATARALDPGVFAAGWPGAIDFDLATTGVLEDDGPRAHILLERVGGTLRQRPLSGGGDLRLAPGNIVGGELRLVAGSSELRLDGRDDDRTDAVVELAIASLGDWLPDAGGRLDGRFRVHGDWPALAVEGQARGAELALAGTHVGAFDLDLAVADVSAPRGNVRLNASAVAAGGLDFTGIAIDAGGTRARHQLRVEATGAPLSTRMALDGSLGEDGHWSGTLSRLDLDIDRAPPLALAAPAPVEYGDAGWRLGELCLRGEGTGLCLDGQGAVDGSLAARYRLEELPLSLLVQAGAPDAPVAVSGVLEGSGEVDRSADGALGGSASLRSPRGGVASLLAEDGELLTWEAFELAVTLAAERIDLRADARLNEDGHLHGEVSLAGPAGSGQALSGAVELNLPDLAFVEVLSPEVANMQGRLVARWTLAGTTAAPELDGQAALEGLALELPVLGIRLHDGEVIVRSTAPDRFALEGRITSGEGTLQLAGEAGVGDEAPLRATIEGTNFLAADIPAARVVLSPDLTIERSAERLELGGSLAIPRADIHIQRLPGGGVTKASPDVVVVDAVAGKGADALPVAVSVLVQLGDNVTIDGHGLEGRISGDLRVEQRPGRAAIGTGTLIINGTYKSYGQDLAIENGRVLFAGTALDNPGLDMRATRTIHGASRGTFDDSTVVGLQVRGTALVPVLTVFSTPVMEQSEALSYLITGKPLSGLASGEGDMLGAAAQALGSAGGDMLAKSIGARTGLDAGVSDSAALGGAAFTVGKYLSPKLYLSYGVGLFSPGEVVTLKYFLGRRFTIEAENATTGNRAGINYRYER